VSGLQQKLPISIDQLTVHADSTLLTQAADHFPVDSRLILAARLRERKPCNAGAAGALGTLSWLSGGCFGYDLNTVTSRRRGGNKVKAKTGLFLVILLLLAPACGQREEESPSKVAELAAVRGTLQPTATFQPTTTPTVQPTATPQSTTTPTLEPTAIPQPTLTPTPEPTATPEPTTTLTSLPEPTVTEPPSPTPAPKSQTAQVVRIIDGDTIEVQLDDVSYKVRLIGVDTPEEGNPFYEEAIAYNGRFVENQTVVLVRDVSETDKAGRLLRYVYVGDIFVNAELVRRGFAHVATYPPDVQFADYFVELQREAREAGRGLWGAPTPEPTAPQTRSKAPFVVMKVSPPAPSLLFLPSPHQKRKKTSKRTQKDQPPALAVGPMGCCFSHPYRILLLGL